MKKRIGNWKFDSDNLWHYATDNTGEKRMFKLDSSNRKKLYGKKDYQETCRQLAKLKDWKEFDEKFKNFFIDINKFHPSYPFC